MTHAENQRLVNLNHKLQNLVNKATACIEANQDKADIVYLLEDSIKGWENTLLRIRTRMATEPVTLNEFDGNKGWVLPN